MSTEEAKKWFRLGVYAAYWKTPVTQKTGLFSSGFKATFHELDSDVVGAYADKWFEQELETLSQPLNKRKNK